jgi:ABC-type transporter Mla subunit MlaD
MSAKANHFKIGVFVLAAAALLVAGLMAFGARSYFQAKDTFETAVPGNVYGLSVGSRVELRGVPIGQVTKISFAWNEHAESQKGFIIVQFEVERDILPPKEGASLSTLLKTAVSQGLRVMVKPQSITGTSLLAMEYLNPVNNPPPEIDFVPQYYYVPSAPGQFTRMLDAVEKTLHNLEQLNMAAISESLTNALGTAVKLADKLDQVDLGKIGDNANSLITEVKTTNVKLQDTLDEIRRTIAGMKLDNLGTNADQLVTGLKETNDKLQRVLDTVGTMPLAETVKDVRQSFETLNQVLLELKQYPSGFIFGQPPAPAKGVQTPSK